ncbi:unnamed protein product, partial [Effrenium voratum]
QLTRQELGDCVRAAFDNPLSESGSAGRPATSGAAVKKLVVFQEEHENGEPHFHVAVLLKAERLRSSRGTAQCWRLRTEQAERKRLCGEAKGAKPKFSKLDLTALVVDKGLRSTADIMAYAQDGTHKMQEWVCQNQRKLGEFLHEACEWEAARAVSKLEKETEWALAEAFCHGNEDFVWRKGCCVTAKDKELVGALGRCAQSFEALALSMCRAGSTFGLWFNLVADVLDGFPQLLPIIILDCAREVLSRHGQFTKLDWAVAINKAVKQAILAQKRETAKCLKASQKQLKKVKAALNKLSDEDLAQAAAESLEIVFRAAFDNPLSESGSAGRPATSGAAVKKLVFQEEHENGEPHFHVAVLLKAERMWLPAKRTLRVRDRLASHWSSTHRHFWSAVRYGAIATCAKPVVDQSPYKWSLDGKDWCLFEASQQPWTAQCWRLRTEQAERKRLCGEAKGAKPKFSKLDLTALVVDKGLRRAVSKLEKETEWALVCRKADEACSHTEQCEYAEAARRFCHGNEDFAWRKGCCVTAKDKELWAPWGAVSAEDVQRMKNRQTRAAALQAPLPVSIH